MLGNTLCTYGIISMRWENGSSQRRGTYWGTERKEKKILIKFVLLALFTSTIFL